MASKANTSYLISSVGSFIPGFGQVVKSTNNALISGFGRVVKSIDMPLVVGMLATAYVAGPAAAPLLAVGYLGSELSGFDLSNYWESRSVAPSKNEPPKKTQQAPGSSSVSKKELTPQAVPTEKKPVSTPSPRVQPSAPPQELVMPPSLAATQQKASNIASNAGLVSNSTTPSAASAQLANDLQSWLEITKLIGSSSDNSSSLSATASQKRPADSTAPSIAAAVSSKSSSAASSLAAPVTAPASRTKHWYDWFSFEPANVPGRPPGIPNTGMSCFAASAMHLMMAIPGFAKTLPGLLRSPNESYREATKLFEANRSFLDGSIGKYMQAKEQGKYTSSVDINGLRRFLPYSEENNAQGYSQQDAHELLAGILGQTSVILDDEPTKRMLQMQSEQNLVSNPYVCCKKVQKIYRVDKDIDLTRSSLVRFDESDKTKAVSRKYSIEIPFVTVDLKRDPQKGDFMVDPTTGDPIVDPVTGDLIRDPQTGPFLPLTELLQQGFFEHKPEPGETEPLKIYGADGKVAGLAVLESEENHFNRIPEIVFISMNRRPGAQETVPVPVTLPWTKKRPNGIDEKGDLELQGYIVRSGGETRGHYVAYIKDKESGRYWYLNDRLTQRTSEKVFVADENKNASYVLLYARKKAETSSGSQSPTSLSSTSHSRSSSLSETSSSSSLSRRSSPSLSDSGNENPKSFSEMSTSSDT